jgi:site-specific recombinase XerD
MQLRVVKGKGAKDRYVAMPDCLLELLRIYYKTYRPQGYLFNGKYKASRWANRSAQHAIKCARTDAGIGRAVSPHVLRHCYATHHRNQADPGGSSVPDADLGRAMLRM